MSDLRKAAQQALEVLKTSGCVAFTGSACYCNSTCSSYTAAVILRDALAQEQAEPVAKQKSWVCACGANLYIDENGAPRSKA